MAATEFMSLTYSYVCDNHHHHFLVDKLCNVDLTSSLVEGAVDVCGHDASSVKQLKMGREEREREREREREVNIKWTLVMHLS